jgi:hypothetical protein
MTQFLEPQTYNFLSIPTPQHPKPRVPLLDAYPKNKNYTSIWADDPKPQPPSPQNSNRHRSPIKNPNIKTEPCSSPKKKSSKNQQKPSFPQIHLSSSDFLKKKRERQLLNDFQLMELKEKKLQREITNQDQALESRKKILQKCKYSPNPPLANVYTTDYYPIKGAYSTLPNPKHSPKSKIFEGGHSRSREKNVKKLSKGMVGGNLGRKVEFEDMRVRSPGVTGQKCGLLGSSNFFLKMTIF